MQMNNVATLSFLYEQGNGDNEGKKYRAARAAGLSLEIVKMKHCVLDGIPQVGIGNVHQTVAGLNHGRIRKLAGRLVL